MSGPVCNVTIKTYLSAPSTWRRSCVSSIAGALSLGRSAGDPTGTLPALRISLRVSTAPPTTLPTSLTLEDGDQPCQDLRTMVKWYIHVNSIRLATINPRNRSAPLNGGCNNHGNTAENCEQTEAGNTHVSAGDVSRRQQTCLERAGTKDLRNVEGRRAERSGGR